jgi:hypothetical protein
LASAARAVHRGGLVLDPSLAREALSPNTPPPGLGADEERYQSLTDREKQVLKLVVVEAEDSGSAAATKCGRREQEQRRDPGVVIA